VGSFCYAEYEGQVDGEGVPIETRFAHLGPGVDVQAGACSPPPGDPDDLYFSVRQTSAGGAEHMYYRMTWYELLTVHWLCAGAFEEEHVLGGEHRSLEVGMQGEGPQIYEAEGQPFVGPDGLVYEPLVRQETLNTTIESGRVGAPDGRKLYLRLRRHSPPGEPSDALMRFSPDELQALAWVTAGALLTYQSERPQGEGPSATLHEV
jgi:hypothetical protein